MQQPQAHMFLQQVIIHIYRKTQKKLYSYICLLHSTLVVERLFLDTYLRQNVDFTVDPVHRGSNTEEVTDFTD
jgi:hypothetical protein